MSPNHWALGLGFLMFLAGLATGDDPFIPDDPHFVDQWGLHNVGQVIGESAGTPGADVKAPAAWAIHRGTSSVLVAIVGTGVDPHPEFADRLLEGCATVGDPYDSLDVGFPDSFGTHVAGIIGAAMDNGDGIAGLHEAVRLLPVRVIEEISPDQRPVAEGITWAVDQGADIVVVPLHYGDGSPELAAAVAYAVAQDVLVVAPSGKTGEDSVAYPAAFDGCLAVAATTNCDERASFSNHGPEVDLAAPGWNIISTGRNGGYFNLEIGSRSAAGLAAGVAALVLSYNPQLSPIEIGEILRSSADDLGEPGRDESFGHGRINTQRALESAPAPALRFERVDPLPTEIRPGTPTSFVIRIASVAETLEPDSAALYHRSTPGPFSSCPLAPLGNELFSVELPATPCEETVEFYLEAAGAGATVVRDPLNAPAGWHTATAIIREPLFDDDFEADQGWTVIVEGDGTQGAWERVVPVGTIAQPGFDRSPDAGTYCFVTGQGETEDVDVGPVRLMSPLIPIAFRDAQISYARWFCSLYLDPDQLIVELSRNNGESWVVVETVAATDGWEQHSFRLSDYPVVTGSELRVRFSTADEDNHSLTEAAIDEFHVEAIRCGGLDGDFDGDGDIDLDDFSFLPGCLAGPDMIYGDGGCAAFDFDDDRDVDLDDWAGFQTLLNVA